MPKPVCVPCGLFFKPAKCGVTWEERMPTVVRDPIDPEDPAEIASQVEDEEATIWTPYKIWIGDLLRCEGCGAELIAGHGGAPVAEHFQLDYAEKRERFGPVLVCVDDC